MAKRGQRRVAPVVAAFAGGDADKENLDKLAAAAAEDAARHKSGANGGEPPDEVVSRNADAIEVALIEIENVGRLMQKARSDLSAAEKTAKVDLGSKGWVTSIKEAIKLKRQAAKGGAGEMVTEHRQIGRVLRLLDVPIGTQLYLLPPEEDPAQPKDEKAIEAEATLAGEHAGLNGEPKENCPHQPGSPEAFGWRNGWQIGADKLTDGFRTGQNPVASDVA